MFILKIIFLNLNWQVFSCKVSLILIIILKKKSPHGYLKYLFELYKKILRKLLIIQYVDRSIIINILMKYLVKQTYKSLSDDLTHIYLKQCNSDGLVCSTQFSNALPI